MRPGSRRPARPAPGAPASRRSSAPRRPRSARSWTRVLHRRPLAGELEGAGLHQVLGEPACAGRRRPAARPRRRPHSRAPARPAAARAAAPGLRPASAARRRRSPAARAASSRLAIVQPPFSGPTRFSLGTFTSVKKVSQKGVVPLIKQDRPRLDARALHVDQQEADALVLLRRVGAHQAEAPVGEMRAARPDLLAVDQVVVALVLGLGLQAARSDAGARLGEALAPAQLALDDRRDVPLLLRPRCRIPAASGRT